MLLAVVQPWPEGNQPSDAALMEGDIATDGGSLKPLAANEIDSLCERLNHD